MSLKMTQTRPKELKSPHPRRMMKETPWNSHSITWGLVPLANSQRINLVEKREHWMFQPQEIQIKKSVWKRQVREQFTILSLSLKQGLNLLGLVLMVKITLPNQADLRGLYDSTNPYLQAKCEGQFFKAEFNKLGFTVFLFLDWLLC